MVPHPDFDERRCSALAYWRYAHDHLRAARTLCARHRLPRADAQASYHLTAQALEFAFHAFMRAKGVPAAELGRDYRHELHRSLDAALSRGLPPPPETVRVAIAAIAPHHGRDRFLHVLDHPEEFPDLAPLFEAVCWMLATIVPTVASDYTSHYSDTNSPSTEVFINRLRADLSATANGADVVLA